MNAYDPYRYYIKIRDGTIIIDEKEYPNIIEKRCFYNKAAFKKSFKELSTIIFDFEEIFPFHLILAK